MPFLGVVITEEGIIPNKEKTKAIEDIKPPTTLKQLRSVLGIFAYYRRFIPRFSEIAKPLYDLTRKRTGKAFEFTEEAQESFDFLKRAITSEPIVLHYPDWERPFEIHTDASGKGLGAVLTQRIDSTEKVIMYASRSLTEIERKYQTYEQECLAVVWAVELFRKYIRNRQTTILTDCAALQWLATRTEGSRVMRWMMRLQEFQLQAITRLVKVADNLRRDAPLFVINIAICHHFSSDTK